MFLLGSFSNGLFSGAQSAMSLYSGYQQISSAIDASNALDQQRASQQMASVNANVPGGWNPDTNKPYGQFEPAGDQSTQSSTEGPVPQGSGTGDQTTTAPRTPVTRVNLPAPGGGAGDGGGGGGGGAGDGGAGGKGAITPPAPTSGAGGPGGDVESQRRQDLDAYNKANPVGSSTKQTTATGQTNPLATPPTTPPNFASDTGLPMPQPNPPPPPGPVARVPMPPQPPPFNAAGVQGAPGTPSGAAPARPDQNPVSQAITGIGNAISGPSAGFTAPPPAPYTPPPPSVTQPVGGYFGGAVGPQTPAMPTGRPGGPVIPPAQTPATVPAAGGAPGIGGTPQAQAAPPPGAVSADVAAIQAGMQQGGAPRPGGTVAAAGPAAGTAPAQGVTPPAPAPAPTPAKPPEKPQPPAVAPVPVAGSAGGKGEGKVAPGQTTPSVQSETTPIAMAPKIDPSAWGQVQKQNPQLAEQIKYAVDTYGAGAVTYEQVAAHMKRESGFNVNVGVGPYGEHGVMQVMPETQASMERLIGHPVDRDSVAGSLQLGVTYLRYLAKDEGLGANTIQTNFAYMRGPGAVNYIKEHGLEAANQNVSYHHALGWTEDMYGGQVKLTSGTTNQGVFTGGSSARDHTPYTAQGALAAAQQGYDGVLQYVSKAGPQGLPMSERWSQLQTALEKQAIWSGHPEMLGHITDWVAQQSHMGAMSNLAAADNALSQGNGALAAQFLAKAHAFFPDGTYMRAGVDQKGQLWAEQFDEGSGHSLGKPIMVDNNAIRQQMIFLQNPTNYVQALQKYQYENANIAMVKAHGDYYRQLPGIKEAQQEAITARQDEREQWQEKLQNERLGFQAANKQAKDENTNALDKDIDTKYDPQNMPQGRAPENWAAQSEIERSLRMPESMGGAALGGPTANSIAQGLATGKMNLERLKDKLSGKDVGYRITDKATGQDRAHLGLGQGEKIESLPGIPHMAGSQPPANPAQRTQNTGIGGGMGSPMVAMSGMNQNMAGIQSPPIQQQQQAAA